MSARAGSRGPGRPPPPHRQSKTSLRPRHVIVVGSSLMIVSSFLFLSWPMSSGPQTDQASSTGHAGSRRFLERRFEVASSSAGRRSTLADDGHSSGIQLKSGDSHSSGIQLSGGVGNQEGLEIKATNTLAPGSGRAGSPVDGAHLQGTKSQSSILKSKKDGLGSSQDGSEGSVDSSSSDTGKSASTRESAGRSSGGAAVTAMDTSTAGDSSEAGPGSRKPGWLEEDKPGSTKPGIRTEEDDPYSSMPIRQLPISHEMDDEELLWRASFISLRDPHRRLGPRKIAFLFSFTSQLFFAPLWAKFFQGHEEHFSVYLHGTENNIDKSTLPAVFHHRFVPVEPASTGTGEPFPHMFAVDSARRLVANALLDMSNEWFLIVCDLCIPLHGFEYFYEYFSANPSRNFVPHQTPSWKNGMDRYIASCYEPLLTYDQWRKGGPWLGLTRRLALALIADIKFYDKFAACCLPAKRGGSEPCFPLEHYLATVLPILGSTGSNYLQPEEVTNWSTAYEDWWTDPWAGKPFVYNTTTVSEKLIKAMKRCHLGNLCHLQGAHFDPDTLPMLMSMSDLFGY